MNKIAIVFWSGTGNTETMANYIAEGVRAAGDFCQGANWKFFITPFS